MKCAVTKPNLYKQACLSKNGGLPQPGLSAGADSWRVHPREFTALGAVGKNPLPPLELQLQSCWGALHDLLPSKHQNPDLLNTTPLAFLPQPLPPQEWREA